MFTYNGQGKGFYRPVIVAWQISILLQIILKVQPVKKIDELVVLENSSELFIMMH